MSARRQMVGHFNPHYIICEGAQAPEGFPFSVSAQVCSDDHGPWRPHLGSNSVLLLIARQPWARYWNPFSLIFKMEIILCVVIAKITWNNAHKVFGRVPQLVASIVFSSQHYCCCQARTVKINLNLRSQKYYSFPHMRNPGLSERAIKLIFLSIIRCLTILPSIHPSILSQTLSTSNVLDTVLKVLFFPKSSFSYQQVFLEVGSECARWMNLGWAQLEKSSCFGQKSRTTQSVGTAGNLEPKDQCEISI